MPLSKPKECLILPLFFISMIDTIGIIERYYVKGSELYNLLIKHSRQVSALALQLAERQVSSHVPVDIDFVIEASMLHDIGIIGTNAPGIFCHGTEPYICHGVIGRKMLDELGLYRHALVCERHTGAGLSLKEIIAQDLPLPHRDLLPLSIEEKLVCYADKFYSKSHVAPARSLEVTRSKLVKFGGDTLARFDAMVAQFGAPDYSAIDVE